MTYVFGFWETLRELREGAIFEMEADGLMAVVIQHESEHLDGKLLLDRLGPVRRRLVQRRLSKKRSPDES